MPMSWRSEADGRRLLDSATYRRPCYTTRSALWVATTMHTNRLKDRTVLIVDDDEDILSSIDFAMRAEGAITRTATDGNAAIIVCNEFDPEAVVLDMMLPKRSGFLVLEKLVAQEEPPVVIMLTANQGRRHMAYAQTLGVHAYLNKPVPLDRLIDTVANLLEEYYEDVEEDE
jgi:DNA-binding response OmpR family regulator